MQVDLAQTRQASIRCLVGNSCTLTMPHFFDAIGRPFGSKPLSDFFTMMPLFEYVVFVQQYEVILHPRMAPRRWAIQRFRRHHRHLARWDKFLHIIEGIVLYRGRVSVTRFSKNRKSEVGSARFNWLRR